MQVKRILINASFKLYRSFLPNKIILDKVFNCRPTTNNKGTARDKSFPLPM